MRNLKYADYDDTLNRLFSLLYFHFLRLDNSFISLIFKVEGKKMILLLFKMI